MKKQVYLIGLRPWTQSEEPAIRALIESSDWCMQLPYEGIRFKKGDIVPGPDGTTWTVLEVNDRVIFVGQD